MKLRGARQRRKAKLGKCEGVKSFGVLVGEGTIIVRMQELRASGLTFEAVAALLNNEGHRTRRGGMLGATVRKIIRAGENAQRVAA